MNDPTGLTFLGSSPRFLFFTGKGGVGKTSIACAASLALTDLGKRVLLVSTDPASNLDEMLGVEIIDGPQDIPGAPELRAINIDPGIAAESYRSRVLAQLSPETSASDREEVREQLSGACTTEIAAFDEFVALIADTSGSYDHVVFDTAPTGHTLRLLSLPKAWAAFLDANVRGASCLGPHSGLKMQELRFKAAMEALSDAEQTVIVLVSRPEFSSMTEAARTSTELKALGLTNQRLVVNGVFRATAGSDPIARSIEQAGQESLAHLPEPLRALPIDRVPFRPFDMVGLPRLRALLEPADADHVTDLVPTKLPQFSLPLNTQRLPDLVDRLSLSEHGLVMVMGKGGVGKTTIAAALAVGLVRRGHSVHLSTTDPAAHLQLTLKEPIPDLQVDCIDPKAETNRYIEKILTTRGRNLDSAGLALLREDLQSPCTEEVAVFHAFTRIIAEARSSFVVLDTAPTGHTLLLMDATGAYHRQMTRDLQSPGKITTPLMRLQDADYTKVILVALPEATPVSEAASLQNDLQRARINPYAWVINRSLAIAGTKDPLLQVRLTQEMEQIERVSSGLSTNVFLVPWRTPAPVGIQALRELADP